ncbi:MAG: hypothetical protein FGM32_10465 [Candidatus Kapabacteria bacterium]|nr:hypothetical protein [Candidatus Kapabacteria bacterium]
MKNRLVLTGLLVSVVCAHAQLITGIVKENARHLWYVSYVNDFDVGYVEWQYGEIRLHDDASTMPIFLELSDQEWRTEGASSRRQGIAEHGADLDLARSGRSRPFHYKAGSALSYYRLWHAVNTCLESQRPHSLHIEGQRSWADVRWTVTRGMIRDTMEVALWMVDATTGQYLHRLDSVGVLGSYADAIARRYGTNPDRALHRVALPDEYAGRNVFIEPIPYRSGPTPFGLYFLKRFNTFNMSALFENETAEAFPGPLPRTDDPAYSSYIDSVYCHDLRQFYADAFADDSCAPALLCLYSLDPHHRSALNAFLSSIRLRRDDPDCLLRAAADTVWWMSTLTGYTGGERQFTMASSLQRTPMFSVSNVTTEACTVTLQNVSSQSCSYRVLSSTGTQTFSGHLGSAPFVNQRLPLPADKRESVKLIVVLDDGREFHAALEAEVIPENVAAD